MVPSDGPVEKGRTSLQILTAPTARSLLPLRAADQMRLLGEVIECLPEGSNVVRADIEAELSTREFETRWRLS